MEEPTAGVDIGAKDIIHRMLRDIAAEGAAVLVVSSDFEEVASLCDRALVVGRGAITAELSGASLTLDGLITRSSLAPSRRNRSTDMSEKRLSRSALQGEAPRAAPPPAPHRPIAFESRRRLWPA